MKSQTSNVKWQKVVSLNIYRRNGMGTFASYSDERVKHVNIEDDMLSVSLFDGRVISVPLAW